MNGFLEQAGGVSGLTPQGTVQFCTECPQTAGQQVYHRPPFVPHIGLTMNTQCILVVGTQMKAQGEKTWIPYDAFCIENLIFSSTNLF